MYLGNVQPARGINRSVQKPKLEPVAKCAAVVANRSNVVGCLTVAADRALRLVDAGAYMSWWVMKD